MNPGLELNPPLDSSYAVIAEAIWGDEQRDEVQARNVGEGWVFHGISIQKVLEHMQLKKDFSTDATSGEILYCHRVTAGQHLYFVANVSDEASATFRATFRTRSPFVSIWDAVSGRMTETTAEGADGETSSLDMSLASGQSVFVVFSDHSVTASSPLFEAALEQPVEGPWNVQLDAFGVTLHPEPLVKLESLSLHKDPQVAHFSGIARYENQFTLAADVWTPGTTAQLDLGDVAVAAEVVVNGINCGFAWVRPYRVDVTNALIAGENTVEVRIATPWANRMIGDADLPSAVDYNGNGELMRLPDWIQDPSLLNVEGKNRTFCSFKYYNGGEPLVKSGLLGPVTLLLSGVAR